MSYLLTDNVPPIFCYKAWPVTVQNNVESLGTF